jgi:hypothetical protein
VDVAKGLVELADLRRLEVMMRELGEMLVESSAMQLLERLSDSPVKPNPLRRGEPVIEGLADEIVREAVAADRAPCRDQQAGADGLLDELEGTLRRGIADPSEDVDAELRPQHGTRGQRLDRRRIEVTEAPGDDITYAGRDGKVQLAGSDVVEAALGDQESHRFADEERVSAGLAAHRGDQLRAGDEPGGLLDEPTDRIFAEAAEYQHPGRRLAAELGECPPQRMIVGELDIAIGPHHEDRGIAQLAREEAKEKQRWRVGGLEIVEDDDERRALPRVPQERRRRVEQLEAGRLRLDRDRRRQIRDDIAHVGNHLRDLDRA